MKYSTAIIYSNIITINTIGIESIVFEDNIFPIIFHIYVTQSIFLIGDIKLVRC